MDNALLNAALGQITTILKGLQGLAVQYGPAAYQAVLAMRRIDALQPLVTGLIALIILAITLKYFFRELSLANKSDWTDSIHGVAVFITGFVGLCCAVTVMFTLLDVWNWIGVFRPDLALAHDILIKVTSSASH